MIGVRKLLLDLSEGEQALTVTVFQPSGQGKDWNCAFEIDWPEGTVKHYGRGADAIQAINIAMKMIGTELYTSDYHKQGRLRWEKPGSGYGFPVFKNIRHLLVGDDREFDG